MSNRRMQSTYAKVSQPLVIRVYNDAGNVIESYEHKGDFKEC